MERVIEFDVENEELKKYLEDCLTEENIAYEIKIEDKWLQKYKDASQYYQVYTLYVDNGNLTKVKQFMEDFENGTIVTDGIEELSDIEEEDTQKTKSKFNLFTKKNFMKYYWLAIFLIGMLIVIASKF